MGLDSAQEEFAAAEQGATAARTASAEQAWPRVPKLGR